MGLTKPRASQIYNLDYKQATRVVTVSDITLSGGAPSSVDGVSLSTNDRILVTGQNDGRQNGIYDVDSVGTGSNGTWVRTNDANSTGEIDAGMIIMVTEGAIYHDTQWKLITDDPIDIGVTVLVFTQNYSANSISGGTSNVTVYSNANVTISSAGTPNVLIISSTGTVTSGTSSITGNVTGGNILTDGQVSATGNLSGNYLLANIAYATGYTASRIYNGVSEVDIATANGNANISINGTSNVAVFSTTGVYITGETSVTGNITGNNLIVNNIESVTGNIIGGNISTAGQVSATGNLSGNYLLANIAYATGYTASRIYNGVSEVDIATANGNANISINGTSNVAVFATTGEYVTGEISATGNVTGANVLTTGLVSATGNATSGNVLTGGQVSATGNATSGNVLTTGIVSATGNIYGGNLSVSGNITGNFEFDNVVSATGNVIAGNIVTAGLVTATGNVTGGNLLTTGEVSAQGNVTGANVLVTTNVSATGNVTGGNLLTSGIVSTNSNIYGGNLIVSSIESVTGNITGGNISTAGQVSATGNLSGNYLLANIAYATGYTASKIYNGTSEANIGTSSGNANISINGVSNVVVVSTDGEYVSGLLSVTGNTTAGNLLTSGLISATGNITGGNANITGTTAATSKTTGALQVAGGVGVAGDLYAGNSITVDGGSNGINSYGNVVTTQFAGLYATANGLNAYSIVQVRSNDGTTGMGIQAYAGLNGKIYSNSGITFTTGATIKDKDFPTGGTSRATIDSTGLTVTGIVSASGNVTGGNIVATTSLTNGNITITGANIVSTGPTLYIDPNGGGGTDGAVFITGNLSVLGNVTYINSNNITTNDLTINVANNASSAAQANGGGIGVGPAGSEYISLTYNSTSNNWVASNGLESEGILSATGNIIGANFNTGGNIVAGNISGGNLLTTGEISGGYITSGNLITAGNIDVSGNIIGANIIGKTNAFNTIIANGQSNINATVNNQTLTLATSSGSGLTWITDAANNTLTLNQTSTGDSIFATGGDMGLVTEPVTSSEDLGLVTESYTIAYDLGSVIDASGLVYPSQLVLPTYTAGTLPGAAPAGQFVFLSTSSVGPMTAFSDGTYWRFTSSGNVVS